MKNKFKYTIHKYIDIWHEDVPESLITKLQGFETYKDQIINEHMYGLIIKEDLQEIGISLNENESEVINKILEYLKQAQAGYFRIVYS